MGRCSRLGGTIVSSGSNGVKIGTTSRLKAALRESEDSQTLNTSFVERLNLTIRHGSAYLRRRSPCHARGADQLRGHVELLRCYYNFVRPHRALRFGRETRTPAMQAGLVDKRLAWSDIFTACGLTLRVLVALVHVSVTVQLTESDAADLVQAPSIASISVQELRRPALSPDGEASVFELS